MNDSPTERDTGIIGLVAYRLAQGVAVVLGAFLGAAVVANLGIGALDSFGLVEPETIGYYLALTLLQFVGFGLAIAGYLLLTSDLDLIKYHWPSRTEWLFIVGGMVALLAMQYSLGALLAQFGLEAGENQVVLLGRANPRFFLYMIVVSVFVVGPMEEILFRGMVQGLLRRAVSDWPAIIFTAVLFGFVHVWAVLGTPDQQFVYAIIATVLGVILGYLYERTDNIVVPALAHGTYNAALFAIQYIGTTWILL